MNTSNPLNRLSGVATLAREIESLASTKDRVFIAIAGPPGCGKSTLSAELAQQIQLRSCVVPMDGFHLDNETLSKLELLHKKGAPETFDRKGFLELIAALRSGTIDYYPTFDRDEDCVVHNGGRVPADIQILIVEGNYLLLDEPGWVELANEWDASVWIEVPEDVLEERLIQRWIDQGMHRDAAREKALRNDMPNARRVKRQVLPSTWVIGN